MFVILSKMNPLPVGPVAFAVADPAIDLDRMTVEQVLVAVSGQLIEPATGRGHSVNQGELDREIGLTGVSTDTRTLRPGELFVALPGTRFDGHRFLDHAFKSGAAGAIVARGVPSIPLIANRDPDRVLIQVADTGTSLIDLACCVRRSSTARTIAVTGSNGKTSTKNLLETCLTPAGETVVSEQSFNNSIGVPLTLLRTRSTTRYCVVEVGTNAPGEIAALSAVVRPEIAVLTQIASAHLAGLGDIDGVLMEKASLLDALPERGVAIINSDDERCLIAARTTRARVITYGTGPDADYRIMDVRTSIRGTRFVLNGVPVELPLPGRFHAWNAAAALAVAEAVGLDLEATAASLRNARPTPSRFELCENDGVTWINDAYNANPASVVAALEELCRVAPSGRRVAVLGAMRELGPREVELHRAVGRRAADLVDRIVTVGDLGRDLLSAARKRGFPATRLHHADTVADLVRILGELVRPGDCVLVKASRSEGLDRVVRWFDREVPSESDQVVLTPE